MEEAFNYAHQYAVGYEQISNDGDIHQPDRHAMEWDTSNDGVDQSGADADTYGDWEIFSRAKPVDWQGGGSTNCQTFTSWGLSACHLVPLPGTGTAGENCDFTNPNGTWDLDEDDKCNWNKIAHGETINIPLFYYDETDVSEPYDDVINDFTGTEEFILRLRTPEGKTIADASSGVIASWEFQYKDGGNSYYLRPSAQYSTYPYYYIHKENINNANMANDYIIIKASDFWETHIIKGAVNQDNFTTNIRDFLATGNKIYFKLTISGDLKEHISEVDIPYLEYQVITDNEIISDNKITYTAEGYSIGKQGTYYRSIQATQGIGNDSVINFALQN